MNERIKELLKQAGGIQHDDDGNELTPALVGTSLEKFAELIVAECQKLNSKELSITAIERLLPLYKEHFGIEE
jgi:hypothetical protein